MMIQVGSSSAMPMSFTMWGWSSFFISTVGSVEFPPWNGGSRFRESQSLSRRMEAEQEELSGIPPRGGSSWFLGMDSLIQGFQRLPPSNYPFP